MTDSLYEDLFKFMVISRQILLRMRNVAGRSCRESQYTHFVFSNIFFSFENLAVYEIMWKKYYSAGQTTNDSMVHAHYMLDN